MRKHYCVLGVAAALIFTMGYRGGEGSAAGNKAGIWKPILDDADAQKLIKRAVDIIQEEAKKPKAGKKAIRKSNLRIQVEAAMIATYAHSAKGANNNAILAGYSANAVKLAQAITKGAPPAQVNKLAADLAAGKAGKGPMGKVAWKEVLADQADVMVPFKLQLKGGDGIQKDLQTNPKLKGKGGNGVEEKVRALARRNLTPAQMKKEKTELALLADKIAAIAQLNYEYAPAQKQGKRDPKDWRDWSVQMRDNALKLAAAAKQGSPAAVKKAAATLNSTCNKCHGVFKPD
jgi:hypothetical protein